MRNSKSLLVSALVIGFSLFSALPALADQAGPLPPTPNPYVDYLNQIKELRQTDKALGDQLHSLRQSIQAQRKADREQKNYSVLLTAKNDQISMINDYTTALTVRLNLQKDVIQYKIDRQANDETTITKDLENVISDLNNQINARNQLVTDAQKILADLGGSTAATPTSNDSTVLHTLDDELEM